MPRGADIVPSSSTAGRMAAALGWFSIALGAAELLAPKALAHWLGMRHGAPILKAYGAREVAAGVGILTLPNKSPGVWSRLAGDALDIATLVSIAIENPAKKRNVGLACTAVICATAADIACAALLYSQPKRLQRR
ncbi:MAG TPA: hypothetical protein VG270_04970 [Pseudolabrys sp.]|jgi:hypothetical protein|nr:hypothetical protein [Pseudolabrys sp.]